MRHEPQSPYLHTIDVVALYLSADDAQACGYRLDVLLHQRAKQPFAGSWALPGLVVNGGTQDESLEAALQRLMASPKVDQSYRYVEQVGTEGSAMRDPRCWSSTTFYLVVLEPGLQLKPDQQLVPVSQVLSGEWPTPFDHAQLVRKTLERLQSKALYSSVPLLFLGDELTKTEMTQASACILGREVNKMSMSNRIDLMVKLGNLAKTDKKRKSHMGRPQEIYNNLRPADVIFFDRSLT